MEGNRYGISQMDVTEILQTKDGFIWIATMKGLIRYDGMEMLVYRENPTDLNSLSDNRIRHLAEDKKGNLWLGTENTGVSYYDRRKEKFTHFLHDPADTNSIPSNGVTDILVDKQDRLWVGTARGYYSSTKIPG